MSLGEVTVRTCPNCGEGNRRATGLRALWVNPRRTAQLCQACAHPLDGSPPTVFDRVIGAGRRAGYYGLNAFAWFAIAIVATILVDVTKPAAVAGWDLPELFPRAVYFAMAVAGAAFGLYRADITRRRGRILAGRSG